MASKGGQLNSFKKTSLVYIKSMHPIRICPAYNIVSCKKFVLNFHLQLKPIFVAIENKIQFFDSRCAAVYNIKVINHELSCVQTITTKTNNYQNKPVNSFGKVKDTKQVPVNQVLETVVMT